MTQGDQPRSAKPEKPAGWSTARDLVEGQGYRGPVQKVEAYLEELQRQLIAERMNTGCSAAEAEAHVNEHLVRTREGHSVIVSPEGRERIVLRRRDDGLPSLKAGWKSEYQIAAELGERPGFIESRMRELHTRLCKQFRAAGLEQVEDYVDQHYLRREEPRPGLKRVWVASPAASVLLGCGTVTAPGQADVVIAELTIREVIGNLIKGLTRFGCSEQQAVEMIGQHVAERMRVERVTSPGSESAGRTWLHQVSRSGMPRRQQERE